MSLSALGTPAPQISENFAVTAIPTTLANATLSSQLSVTFEGSSVLTPMGTEKSLVEERSTAAVPFPVAFPDLASDEEPELPSLVPVDAAVVAVVLVVEATVVAAAGAAVVAAAGAAVVAAAGAAVVAAGAAVVAFPEAGAAVVAFPEEGAAVALPLLEEEEELLLDDPPEEELELLLAKAIAANVANKNLDNILFYTS